MKQQKVTMLDIAKRLGISRTAVSFALNGLAAQKGVSPHLEEQINNVAKELNYMPPRQARTIYRQQTKTLGIILPQLSVRYGSLLVQNAEKVFRKTGFNVLLAQHDENYSEFDSVVQNYIFSKVSGIIIVPPLDIDTSNIIKKIQDSNTPLVFVERDPEIFNANFVAFDPVISIKNAITLIAEKGHEKIALFDASKMLAESRSRDLTFKQMLEHKKLTFCSEWVYNAKFSTDEDEQPFLEDFVHKMMAPKVKPTAIIAVSAHRAIRIYKILIKLGFSVPSDISLICITGLDFDDFHLTHITSVKLSYEQVGRLAAKLLLEAVKDDSAPPQRILIPPTFVEGDTLAKPPIDEL